MVAAVPRIDAHCERIDRRLIANLSSDDLIDRRPPNLGLFGVFTLLAHEISATSWFVCGRSSITMLCRHPRQHGYVLLDRLQRLENW